MELSAATLHEQSVIVDGHCDTLLELYNKKRSFWKTNQKGHLDWPRLLAGKVNVQFMAIYIEPPYKPCGSLARVLELLDYFRGLQADGDIKTILSKQDVLNITPHVHAVLLAIEGGEALEGKLGVLRVLFDLGFRSMTLTWNQRNSLADGVWEKDSRGGLTALGREVTAEMNRLGMLIDVSHLSEAGFWDVIALSKQPVSATHSCCKALRDHPRNLSDEQLRAIRQNNGIIGINFYPGFLCEKQATIDHVIDHLEHAAVTAGIDHVGLGSDFDGITKTPQGLENAAQFPRLTARLLERGWKPADIQKVLGGNFIRVLRDVLP